MADDVFEIRVQKFEELSGGAQREVKMKLDNIKTSGVKFDYRGYAKITYTRASPLRVISVDPIEGSIVELFEEITRQCGI